MVIYCAKIVVSTVSVALSGVMMMVVDTLKAKVLTAIIVLRTTHFGVSVAKICTQMMCLVITLVMSASTGARVALVITLVGVMIVMSIIVRGVMIVLVVVG
jgi:hypothetical protein